LKEAGVRTVFGIPSIHNIGLYEALRKEPSIRHIVCRHEAAATHMADGYARASRGLGVILSSTGPGAGFTVSPLQEAWGSCSPVLMITTNIDAPKIGQGLGALHELEEQSTLFRTITKATLCARPGDDFYTLTQKAMATALSGRPGPVYLEAPTDLLAGETETERGQGRSLSDSSVSARSLSHSSISQAVSLLRRARQPLIVAGTDAVRAGLGQEVTALAETLPAPVITSTPGKGILPEDHPLAFGNAARRGAVREMVNSCDVALAIGTRLREVDAKRRGLALPQLIHVDWDERWLNKNFPVAVPLIGDIRAIAQELQRQLGGEPYRGQRQQRTAELRKKLDQEVAEIRRAHVEMRYLDMVRRSLPRTSALVVDNTVLGYWAEYFYPSYQPGGLVAAKGSALLGFAFPAAMGVKVACPEKPVVAVIGDGGFLYTAQELATCVRHNIAFPVIVVNDSAYGVIRFLQKSAYQEEYESQLTNPDFVAFARSFGVSGTRVTSPEELGPALEGALASGEMRLIELVADFSAPPFGRY
jgi:acetolactate synthase-1/2/3 large subunit